MTMVTYSIGLFQIWSRKNTCLKLRVKSWAVNGWRRQLDGIAKIISDFFDTQSVTQTLGLRSNLSLTSIKLLMYIYWSIISYLKYGIRKFQIGRPYGKPRLNPYSTMSSSNLSSNCQSYANKKKCPRISFPGQFDNDPS